jgi:hypothetical protein
MTDPEAHRLTAIKGDFDALPWRVRGELGPLWPVLAIGGSQLSPLQAMATTARRS